MMSVRFLVSVATSVLVAVVAHPAAASDADTQAGQVLVEEIRKRAEAFEEEYIGSFSKRDAHIEIQEPESREVQSTKDVQVDVWEYHGENPTRIVKSCKVDGEPVDLSECEEKQQLEPAYRIFNDEGRKHYRLEYKGKAEWNGQPSHRVQVIPVEDTPRHLKGDIYFEQEKFRPIGMNFTLAKFPFGLQELNIEMSFEMKEGRPVLKNGKSDVYIYVPLLIDERRVTTFEASDQKLLTERHAGS